jgi:hypothetical protein
MNCKLQLQHFLTDITSVDDLIDIWNKQNTTEEFTVPIPAILCVDAMAIRSLITLYEDGNIEGLQNFIHLETPDLFEQFIANPCQSHEFIGQHWDLTYSSFFIYHIQSITLDLICCAIHCVGITNRKADPETLEKLQELVVILRMKEFNILGYVFDGDSYFDSFHSAFQDHWKEKMISGRLIICVLMTTLFDESYERNIVIVTYSIGYPTHS